MLNSIAKADKLTLGIVFPLESYSGSIPKMQGQESLAQLAEEAGFSALWFRDVPFHDPSFGDAGQMYDPFVYMTHIMNHTKSIALATGSIILPLRHPVHTIKSINSLQVLSKGRIIVGVASGDRPLEYPAFNKDLQSKSVLFQESYVYMKSLQMNFPTHQSTSLGSVHGQIDILPKSPYPTSFLVTGYSGQTMEWIAKHSDGWIYYPRNPDTIRKSLILWKATLDDLELNWKPYMQSLYIDLITDRTIQPSSIHLGFRSNPSFLLKYLLDVKKVGVNHVIINAKFNSLSIEKTLDLIGKEIMPFL